MTQTVLAQIDNKTLEDSFALDSTFSKRLSFQFSTLHFVKNNEYFNEIADGYTLWGYQLNPKLAYQPTANVSLTGGVFLQHDFGKEGFSQALPTFTIKIKHHQWNYVIGTLDGSVGHRLIEPLYNFERLLKNRIENGLQVRKITEKQFFDFWISYPQTTGPGQDGQEMFWGGLSSDKLVYEKNEFKIRWPFQFTGFHVGGQNLATPQPIRSAFHLNTGLSFDWQFSQNFLKGMSFTPYFLVFNEIADQNKNGWALYPNATFYTKPFTIQLSYWQGKNYVADYGGDLYQSISRKFGNLNYKESNRNLLIFRFIRDIKVIDNLNVSIRFEPYFDLINKIFEHSEGIYVSYRLAHHF